MGLRWAQKRALEGPIFMSVSDLGSLEYGIAVAETTGGGCICVPDTHTEALDGFSNLLVFVGSDFELERGSKQGV